MPIFEYHCKECECEFEKLVFRSDDSDVACPSCQSGRVEKKMSAASVMSGSLTEGGGCAPSPAKGFG